MACSIFIHFSNLYNHIYHIICLPLGKHFTLYTGPEPFGSDNCLINFPSLISHSSTMDK